MPCSSFSRLQNHNGGTRTTSCPAGDGTLDREIIGNKLADVVSLLCRALHNVGCYFSIQNPRFAPSWLYLPSRDLVDISFDVDFDQCMFGLAPPHVGVSQLQPQPSSLKPQFPKSQAVMQPSQHNLTCISPSCSRIKKPIRIRTNLTAFKFLARKCDGRHVHYPCYGSVKTYSGWQKKTENGGFCSFVNARVNLANERCALSSSQTPRVSVTWRAHHQRRARHRPRSPPPSQPPPHVRARERASERAPPPPPLHARGSSSSSSCCRRRVVLWVAWVPWVLQRG